MQNFSGCVACPSGFVPASSPPDPRVTLIGIPLGCSQCPNGTISHAGTCTLCGKGWFPIHNQSSCQQCGPIPKHAEFTGAYGCDFECEDGFIDWPLCMSPIGVVVSAFGGYAIIGIALGVLCVVIGIRVVVSGRRRCTMNAAAAYTSA